MRKRNNVISIRCSDEELKEIQDNQIKSGQTMQSFVINSLMQCKISTSEEIKQVIEISSELSEYVKQLRGMATNINQMAKFANSCGSLPAEEVLRKMNDQVVVMRNEGEKIWQSIRQLIKRQKVMPHSETV